MYWVLSQLTWHRTSGWKSIELCTYLWIAATGQTTAIHLQVKYPDNYVNLQLDDNIDDIIYYKKDPTQLNWKIALPESMVVDTVKRSHLVMGHPGEKDYKRRLTNVIITPDCAITLINWSANIA